MSELKHLFVPYEIALQLKEKGFGLSNDDYLKWFAFYEDGVLNNAGIPEANICRKYNSSPNHLGADTINDFEASVIMIDNSFDNICIAPLYQQVIDWFREKHEIGIEIFSGHDEDKFWYNCNLSKEKYGYDYEPLNSDDITDDTYYGVLIKAIEEALKLI